MKYKMNKQDKENNTPLAKFWNQWPGNEPIEYLLALGKQEEEPNDKKE